MTGRSNRQPWSICDSDPCACTASQFTSLIPDPTCVERVAHGLCDGDAGDHGSCKWEEAGELEPGSERSQDWYRGAARSCIATVASLKASR